MRKIDKRFFRGLIFGRARNDSARRMRSRYWRVSILLALAMFISFVVPSMFGFILLMSPLGDLLFLIPINLFGKVFMAINLGGVLVGMVLGSGVMLAGYFFLQRPIMADLVAANGYCGSCFYTLTEIKPDSDGCSVCPECGSGWRCQEKLPSPA